MVEISDIIFYYFTLFIPFLAKSGLDMKVCGIDYAFRDTFDWFLFNITVRKYV
jgi:hypothetical protein